MGSEVTWLPVELHTYFITYTILDQFVSFIVYVGRGCLLEHWDGRSVLTFGFQL